MHSSFFEFTGVDEIPQAVIKFVWWFTHTKEIRFEVTLGHWDTAGFDILVDFNCDCGELVPADTTKNPEEVLLQ